MDGFTEVQKRYLEGFMSGLQLGRSAGLRGPSKQTVASDAEPTGPDAAHIRAQNRFLGEGKKLSEQEVIKREQHPFDGFDRLKEESRTNSPPSAADAFRWRWFGLFFQPMVGKTYMCRARVPNGSVKHWQFAELANLTERYGNGKVQISTRANLQIRDVQSKDTITVIQAYQEIGLTGLASGADNVRNVIGNPAAGIDPQELLDTRPYGKELHFQLLSDRSLSGIPRKFNVAFDGGGIIPLVEEGNDVAFVATNIKDGFGVEPGIWFRLWIGGVPPHNIFAKDSGVIVRPSDAAKLSVAIVRVFIDYGNRAARNKARLKYLLDEIGPHKFFELVEERYGNKLTRVSADAISDRPPADRTAHIGVRPQKQAGLNWIGVAMPLGMMTSEQVRGLAKLAHDLGDGDIRTTIWQNLLISGIADHNVPLATAAIEALGLAVKASPIRTGLVACTGTLGCKYANTATKRHALEIASWCEERVAIDTPLNIHVTGCPNSCAQAGISDIGLLGTKVSKNEEEDSVEGYHIYAGGSFGPNGTFGKEVFRDVPADEAPSFVESLLRAYVANRTAPDEPFVVFASRYDGEALKKLAEAEAAA
ncbi:NirA family protein [Bradyrhizobium tropiciagri]|uniref:NirA family protein n=1 Tax=Bradyrhizobium tropiciagri TaxID=312253 RepID=UPI001BACE044|nr:NirA family protein [Bradyrhizobium tropiciagri]MBR0898827.1 NirA family protein [Bradyrhizobium tropiciagri]